MELKEGILFRTKKGIIRKWGEYDRLVKNWDDRYNYNDEDGDLIFTFESEIAKYSNNIIDLIKVGDYVLVKGKDTFLEVKYIDDCEGVLRELYFTEDGQDDGYWNEDIKNIVTKEQFNTCKYVVERDK